MMPEAEDGVWRALADPTRRGLLDLLREGAKTTGVLAGAFPGLSRFGVMKHLGVLEEAGLVVVERRGRERWNHLNPVPLRRVYDRWVGSYEHTLAGSMVRLQQELEEEERMGVKLHEEPARVAHVVAEIEIAAPRGKVYRAWFDRVGDWFYENEEARKTRPTRWEGERIGAKCYLEYPGGGFNVIGELTMVKPGEKIRMRGDCTGEEAFFANMTVSFTDTPGGTRVRVDHRMTGQFADPVPGEFEEGWLDGLVKLKALVESGV